MVTRPWVKYTCPMKNFSLLVALLLLSLPLSAQEDEEPDSHDPYDQTTPLIDAVKADDEKQIQALLGSDDPNEVVGAGPALMWARSASVVRLLVAGGAQPNLPFHDTTVLAMQVQQSDNFPVIAALLEVGAQVTDESLFSAAEYADDLRVVKALIDHGAPLAARDELGRTAFLVAAGRNAHVPVIQALLEGGSDPSATDNEGQTALMNAVVGRNSLEVFRYLKNNTAGGVPVDKKGRSVEALIRLFISENPNAFLAALKAP